MRTEIGDTYARYKPPAGLAERDRLVLENLRLVIGLAYATARKFQRRRFLPEPEDLIQSGMIGLIKAAAHYNSSRGMFSTFASYFIRGAIFTTLKDGGAGTRGDGEKELLRKSEQLPEELRGGWNAFERIEWEDEVRRLEAAMNRLSPVEADVIIRHYGLCDREPETFESIASTITKVKGPSRGSVGVSTQYVHQIETSALRKIPVLMRKKESE